MPKQDIKQIFSQEIKELFKTDKYKYAYIIDINSYVVKTDTGLVYVREEPMLQRRLDKEYMRYINRVKQVLDNAPHIMEMDLYSEIWDEGFNIGGNYTTLYSYSGTNEHIRIPPGVTQVVRKAFKDYDALTLTFNLDLEHIGFQSFYGWTQPHTLKFNHRIKTVGAQAFYNWVNLEQLVLSKDLEEIGDEAFANTPNLTEVIVLCDVPPTIGDNVFGDNTTATIYVPTEKVYLYKNAWVEYQDQIKSIVERPVTEVD